MAFVSCGGDGVSLASLLFTLLACIATQTCSNASHAQSPYSLAPSPVLSGSSLVQCGCNNSALNALTPTNSSTANKEQPPTELTLTGFFFIDSSNGKSTCGGQGLQSTTGHLIPAALTALDEINNSSDILPGYHLILDLRDSRCDEVHATAEFAGSIVDRIMGIPPSNQSFNVGILGSACSSETLGGISSRSLNLPVVSYGLHPQISSGNGNVSSLFYVSRSTLLVMQSAIGLMENFGWTSNVAFVSQDVFLPTIESVVMTDPLNNMLLSAGGIVISVSEFTNFAVGTNGLAPSNLVPLFFDTIRTNNLRVILGLLTQRVAAQLICTGRLGTIPGDGFVYVFVGSFSSNWWQTETEYCNLTRADVESVIIVSGNIINPDSFAVLESGNTIHDFKVEYVQRLRMWCNNPVESNGIDPSAGVVYDAVWSLALALNQSTDFVDMAVQHGLHYNSDTLTAINEAMGSLNFSGVTGRVQFMGNQREGAESIQQIQNGVQVTVGLFLGGKLLEDQSMGFVWNGSSGVIPSANVRDDPQGVGLYWIVIGLVFTVAGIIFAIAMWIFNCYFSKHRILRASSQKLNYVIIVGVIFGYVTVLLLTIIESPLGSILDDEVFKVLCLVRIWTLPLAFTFTYSLLFARAWRIYRVFNNPWMTSRPYKDIHLMLMVLVVAAVDVMILVPWTIIDPYRRRLIPTVVDYNSFSRCVFSGCSSTNVIVWLSVLSIYKVFIIMGGILVISLVRKEVVARKIFDDTKSLAAAVYITAAAFLIGLPLTVLALFANQIVFLYIASATWVNISSSGTLICVFLPKVFSIMIKKDSGKSYKPARRLYYGKTFSTTAANLSVDDTLIGPTNTYTVSVTDIVSISGVEGPNRTVESTAL